MSKGKLTAIIVACVVVIAVVVIMVLPKLTPTPDLKIGVSVAELHDGVMIGNVGDVDCIVTVTSREGEQQFELAGGESMTVTGMTQPIEVVAVSR